MKQPKVVLQNDAVYLGDNGRCYCGLHSGMSARYTGRDISGQTVYRVTPDDARAYPELCCEECGAKPSLIWR